VHLIVILMIVNKIDLHKLLANTKHSIRSMKGLEDPTVRSMPNNRSINNNKTS